MCCCKQILVSRDLVFRFAKLIETLILGERVVFLQYVGYSTTSEIIQDLRQYAR